MVLRLNPTYALALPPGAARGGHRRRGEGQTPCQSHVSHVDPVVENRPNPSQATRCGGLRGTRACSSSRTMGWRKTPPMASGFGTTRSRVRRPTTTRSLLGSLHPDAGPSGHQPTTHARHRSSRSGPVPTASHQPMRSRGPRVTRTVIRRANTTTHVPHTRCIRAN